MIDEFVCVEFFPPHFPLAPRPTWDRGAPLEGSTLDRDEGIKRERERGTEEKQNFKS